MNETILLIEDDDALVTMLSDRLRSERYQVDAAKDAEEAMDKISSSQFDLLIVDVMLPGRSGFDLCSDVRRARIAVPILFLTAKTALLDKVVGLKLGADDYLTKPFEAEELIARVEALLRRMPNQLSRGFRQIASLRIDVRGSVTRDGRPIDLTRREFELLWYLTEHPRMAFTRANLLKAVWRCDGDVNTRTVDQHIYSLRKKIEKDADHPDLIITINGVGYMLVDC
jgi:two-component system alkaline phosphatase synthesis response regulator PhoP